jgi:hypothetical protein
MVDVDGMAALHAMATSMQRAWRRRAARVQFRALIASLYVRSVDPATGELARFCWCAFVVIARARARALVGRGDSRHRAMGC